MMKGAKVEILKDSNDYCLLKIVLDSYAFHQVT